MNKDLTYKKMLTYTDKVQIRLVGRYLDKVKYKWFNKVKRS
jgi:hypothetical protein